MTPTTRKKHIQSLKETLTNLGLAQDSYGNFKHPSSKYYRIKFLQNNYRFEQRYDDLQGVQWTLLKGGVLVKTTVDEMLLIGQRLTELATLNKEKLS